jgi:hypothetical protein
MRVRRVLQDEGGSVLVIAIIFVLVALGLGAVVVAASNVQSHQTAHETAGEAAFNLAESALDAQTRLLQLSWPGRSVNSATCNQSSPATTTCPGATVTNSFASSYAGQQYGSPPPTWSIQVVDDSGTEASGYYSDPPPPTALGCDCNGDNKVWVRVQAAVLGQTRIVVAEVVRQSSVVPLPKTVVTAGGTYTDNNGNKVIINENDVAGSGLTGSINLTCGNSSTKPVYQTGCAGWDAGKNQVNPGAYQTGYSDPNGYSVLSPDQLASLKATAIAEGGYYNSTTGCPTNLNGLVYVDGISCSYTGNGSWNGPYNSNGTPAASATPGMLIFSSGTLTLSATIQYFGIIYMANTTGATPQSGPCPTPQNLTPVLKLHGNVTVYGAVFVDNCGLLDAGDSATNLNFDSLAFGGAQTYDTPVLAKNTFRIIANP